MVKSGADYKNLSFITVEERQATQEELERVPSGVINDKNVETEKVYTYQIKDNQYVVNIQKYDVTKDVEPDQEIKEHVELYYKDLDKKMKIVNSRFNCEIDIKFSSVRTKETKIGNFIADIMRMHHHCDVGLINSGGFRPDRVYEEGDVTIGDWNDIFPFETPVLKVQMSGAALHRTLENSVSKYPSFEGRFLQVSGVKFKFNPSKEVGSRINPQSMYVAGNKVNMEQDYTVACTFYMGLGKEGYTDVGNCLHIIDIENAPLLKHILGEFFGIFSL